MRGVGHYVPPRVVTNNDLSKLMDTSDEWIVERTGIRERRFADAGVTTSDLGVLAAKKALEAAKVDASEIDFLIAATLSPDMFFPGIGTMIQTKMGLKNVPALDIRAQCSGFVYGLATADAFIRSGQAKKVLLVCSELHSAALDMTTRGRDVSVLFGDGAAAAVIEAQPCTNPTARPTAQNNERGIIDSIMGSDGTGAEVLCLKTPGMATPHFITHADIDAGAHFPKMDGRLVFKNAVTRMIETVTEMIARNKVSPEQINLLIPHQANLRINEMVREKLGLPQERVFNNIQKYGNTTAATIPLCMSEAQAQGKLKQGDLVLTVAFGAGFTWGSNLLRW